MAPRPEPRPAQGAPGARVLITAAALAGTLGGWALLTPDEPTPAAGTTGAPGMAQLAADLPPIPTLVPAPEAFGAAVQAAAPAQAAPVREVTAPQPVARTRSSQ